MVADLDFINAIMNQPQHKGERCSPLCFIEILYYLLGLAALYSTTFSLS